MERTGIISGHQKSVDFAQRALDLLLLLTAWRLHNPESVLTDTTLIMLGIVALSFELTAALSGLYVSHRSRNLSHLLFRTAVTILIAFGVLIFFSYLSGRLLALTPKHVLIPWLITTLLLMLGVRLLYRPVLGILRKWGLNQRTACVLGDSASANTLRTRLHNNPWMGITVQQNYALNQRDAFLAAARHGLYDQIYLALPLCEQGAVHDLIAELADTSCSVYLVPDVFTFDLLNARTELIDGLPIISIYDTPFTLADQLLKRSLDIVVSSAALILLSPLLLVIATAVKLTSPGPAIFKQTRYGLNSRSIQVWKFRSMITEDNGSVVKQATQNDSRLTPIGGFLRKLSLDELPQFINVLSGSMSVVGPRPHAVAHNELYRQQILGYMLRHKVKPGITGWAQVNGWRGETDVLEKMQKRIEYDIEYIRRWSLYLDIKIIVLTALKGFFGKNAY